MFSKISIILRDWFHDEINTHLLIIHKHILTTEIIIFSNQLFKHDTFTYHSGNDLLELIDILHFSNPKLLLIYPLSPKPADHRESYIAT